MIRTVVRKGKAAFRTGHRLLRVAGVALLPREISDRTLMKAIGLKGRPAGRREVEKEFLERVVRLLPGPRQVDPKVIPADLIDMNGILDGAENVLGGKVEALGQVFLTKGKGWSHKDPYTGHIWPPIYMHNIRIRPKEKMDAIFAWEINRHWHFLVLAQAYYLSGQDGYLRGFEEGLDEWMTDNPRSIGINWLSGLEVAIRSLQWLYSLGLFYDRGVVPSSTWRMMKQLLAAGRFLDKCVREARIRNNHRVGEATGLAVLGLCFGGSDLGRKWYATASRVLEEEILRQVVEDGGDAEQAVAYHRLVMDCFTIFYLVASNAGWGTSSAFRDRLEAMYRFCMQIIRPDGDAPYIGDDDGGRALRLTKSMARHFLPALSTGAALFGRADMKWLAGKFHEESLWLLGKEGLAIFDGMESRPPERQSVCMANTGLCVMRTGWGKGDSFLVFDCGPHGMGGGGHGHADSLSIELFAHGEPLIVDPGTYAFSFDFPGREYFRGTSAHNTVVVDGRDQGISLPPPDPFGWVHKADGHLIVWRSGLNYDLAVGYHRGYDDLPQGVVHKRTVLFVKSGYWIIKDDLITEGKHRYDLYWHLAPGKGVLFPEGQRAIITGDGAPSAIMWAGDVGAACRAIEGCDSPMQGWVSSEYGRKEKAPVVMLSWETKGPVALHTVISPYTAGDPWVRGIEETLLPDPRGDEGSVSTGLTIATAAGTDYFFFEGREGQKKLGPVETDAILLHWASDKESGALRGLAIGCTFLRWNGTQLLRSEGHPVDVELVISGERVRVWSSSPLEVAFGERPVELVASTFDAVDGSEDMNCLPSPLR